MRILRTLTAIVALSAGACFFHTVQVDPLEPAEGIHVTTRARAHLADGTTIIYPQGFTVRGRVIQGVGTRYGLRLAPSGTTREISLDSIVGIESYTQSVDLAPTILVSALATASAALGSVALYLAIFGSCPTFYSDSAGSAVLEAEGFSYSIARIFEGRDVDRLRATTDAEGRVRLEVRNEALETHYVNHLEVLEVTHTPGEVAVPDPAGRALVLGASAPPAQARDRSGRDVLAVLTAADGGVYQTAPDVLALARADDLDDYIDLELPVPAGADSVALIFRIRNSLLNTVLFYDVMLADRGARAIDWVGRDLEALGPAAEVGRWARQAMGLRVSVREGNRYREVTRVPDVGPIAWKDVALVVPVTEHPRLRVRLSFLVDDWRIDRVAVAAGWRRPAVRTVPLARVIGSEGRPDTAALASLHDADDRRLETHPGERFTAEFDAGASPSGVARTFFLASQGYYIEWMRRDWMGRGNATATFTPGQPALLEAVRRWRTSQDSLERLFYSTRIPVR